MEHHSGSTQNMTAVYIWEIETKRKCKKTYGNILE